MDLEAQQAVFKGLYANLEPKIWVVKTKSDLPDGSTVTKTRTAFAVHKDGYLLTSYHENYLDWVGAEIKVRTLVGTNKEFVNEASFVAREPGCDLCLLKIDKNIQVDAISFGSGNLDICQTIVAIGHPYSCFGSGLRGRVHYPCTVNPVFEFDESESMKCREYPLNLVEKTSAYRIMGHLSNVDYFDDSNELAYVRELQANTPIIQASGLVGGGGGSGDGVDGSSGAPIFNLKGELVGMFLFGMDGYDIGLHVTVIKKFVDESCPNSPKPESPEVMESSV